VLNGSIHSALLGGKELVKEHLSQLNKKQIQNTVSKEFKFINTDESKTVESEESQDDCDVNIESP